METKQFEVAQIESTISSTGSHINFQGNRGTSFTTIKEAQKYVQDKKKSVKSPFVIIDHGTTQGSGATTKGGRLVQIEYPEYSLLKTQN